MARGDIMMIIGIVMALIGIFGEILFSVFFSVKKKQIINRIYEQYDETVR